MEGGGKDGRKPGGWYLASVFQRILSNSQDQSSCYLHAKEMHNLFCSLSHSSSAFPQASAPSVGLWGDPTPAQNEAQLKPRTHLPAADTQRFGLGQDTSLAVAQAPGTSPCSS